MKKIILTDDTLPDKISYWLLVAFLIALPFDFFYSELILISFAAHTLIHCPKSNLKLLISKEVLLLCSIFILGALAILYSPNKPEGINIMTRQLAIFIFPVLFALTRLDLQKYQHHFFYFFSFTVTLTVIYLFADALNTINSFHLPFSSLLTLAFMNHNFSLPIDIHATYLSIYVAFSIIIFSFLLSKENSRALKILYTCCLFILSLGLLQLSSRAVFIALLVVVNIAFPIIFFTGKRRIKFIVISLILSFGLLYGITYIDSFKVRYINDLKKDLADKLTLFESDDPRMYRWEAILEMVKKSPVTGYGTGSEKEMLKTKYFEKKLYSSYLNEFNTHSEYLSFLLKMGIPGLALFIYVLITGFIAAWKKREPVFLGFLVLISIVSISENVLDLNKGIFFYSFFFSLFLLKDKFKKDNAVP